MATNTDRIERDILLRAPRSRVWQALTDPVQFGTWFRVKLETGFAVGQQAHGRITYPGYEHLRFEATVRRMDAEHDFSYRWHPYAVDPKVDYSAEPTTLVEFHLDDEAGGTRLTIVESGFDALPPGRRDEAYRMNDSGWATQLDNIRAHVAG